MKYSSPKNFNPSPEDQKRAASELSKHLSSDKVLITQAGDKVPGTKKSN